MTNEIKPTAILTEERILSTEVALMVDKQHKILMRDIRSYGAELVGYNFVLSDFFTPTTYVASNNKTLPAFLVTKKGCEFIANKLSGKKGTLFTATYVSRFNEMEQRLADNLMLQVPQTFAEALQLAGRLEAEKEQLLLDNTAKATIIEKNQPKVEYHDEVLTATDCVSTTQIASDYDISAIALNKILNEKGLQHKVSGATDTVVSTKWTQAGRKYIDSIMKELGFVAHTVDRDV